MRSILTLGSIVVAVAAASTLTAQQATQPVPVVSADPKDVNSMDAIISALYESNSIVVDTKTSAERFRSLFLPGARLLNTGPMLDGKPGILSRSLDEYLKSALSGAPRGGFRESEIVRSTEMFGHIAQVFSTYEARRNSSDNNPTRGINSFQLFFDGSRWWVISVMWENERANSPIPSVYLPKKP